MAKVIPSGFAAHFRLFFTALFFLPIIIGVASCKSDSSREESGGEAEETLVAPNPIMRLLSPEASGIDFANQLVETYDNNITTNINMYNGGGLAIADINNDGLPDVYFISCSGRNRLYLNEGHLRFKDITRSAGVDCEAGFKTAATAVDINNDGFLDLYVCQGGENNEIRRNKLYVNNGTTPLS